ncbi:MAG: hypothetical protein Q9209_006067 [Squamulea sp. 1 TL-2023]
MPQVALAVVGTPGSGKSTFIQHALDLKKLPTAAVSSKKVSLEGVVSLLRIHEFNVHDIDLTIGGTPQWPHLNGEETTSPINGTMVIYSISDAKFPRIANGTNRPRASTNVNSLEPVNTHKASASKSKHQRVQSDFPTKLKHTDSAPSFNQQGYGCGETVSAGSSQENQAPSPLICVHHGIPQPSSRESTLRELGKSGRPAGDPPDTYDECGFALQHEEQMQASIPPTVSAFKNEGFDVSSDTSQEAGLSFDELVDRLLSSTVVKTDVKFAAIFLCLYRKFSAPSDLLAAIISRFESVDTGQLPQAIQSAAQLRYLGVLAQWVAEYPGDFAHPLTRVHMEDFVSGLAGHKTFSMVIKEITLYLDAVTEDDDTGWACSDKKRSRTDTVGSFPSISLAQDTSSTPDTGTLTKKTAIRDYSCESPAHKPESGSTTSPTISSAGKSSIQSFGSAQGQSTVENAQSQARLLEPYPRTSLCKVHWHLFMRSSDEDIAQELTRIDWIMFSSIRPRDLVRHVSLRDTDKEHCKSLENVTRMIHQFNHIAFWIANIILLRDKPKHRAKILEKCMAVAWRLRQLNNYNSLGAVVAGINGTAVHRLYQTRELVPHHVQKQFMRLEILMGTQKSHFAYRLAWSNTSTERIPFLPLHSRDLASAEDANPTYIGEGDNRINWKKFEVLGEVVVSIQKSQASSYLGILRNEEIQRLILDSKFTKDDDELYDRSIQLEGLSATEMPRKRFNWLLRG